MKWYWYVVIGTLIVLITLGTWRMLRTKKVKIVENGGAGAGAGSGTGTPPVVEEPPVAEEPPLQQEG